MNAPENTVKEIMEGFAGAYERYYEKHPRVNGIILKRHRKSQVALVIGGGSGHEPMFSGFVGEGLADAAACGNILHHRIPIPYIRQPGRWNPAEGYYSFTGVILEII